VIDALLPALEIVGLVLVLLEVVDNQPAHYDDLSWSWLALYNFQPAFRR
jgi:hypothetical protein